MQCISDTLALERLSIRDRPEQRRHVISESYCMQGSCTDETMRLEEMQGQPWCLDSVTPLHLQSPKSMFQKTEKRKVCRFSKDQHQPVNLVLTLMYLAEDQLRLTITKGAWNPHCSDSALTCRWTAVGSAMLGLCLPLWRREPASLRHSSHPVLSSDSINRHKSFTCWFEVVHFRVFWEGDNNENVV